MGAGKLSRLADQRERETKELAQSIEAWLASWKEFIDKL